MMEVSNLVLSVVGDDGSDLVLLQVMMEMSDLALSFAGDDEIE
jgi:hypothetical protein